MKPINGGYRLDYAPGIKWEVVIDDTGMDTPVGRFSWVSPPGYYRKDEGFSIHFIDQTHYEATYKNEYFSGPATKIS